MNEWKIKKHNTIQNSISRWGTLSGSKYMLAIIEWFQNRNVMPVFNMNQINWKKEITIKIYI